LKSEQEYLAELAKMIWDNNITITKIAEKRTIKRISYAMNFKLKESGQPK
jgi:hypothetical protein